MNNKIMGALVASLVVIIISVVVFFLLKNNNNNDVDTSDENETINNNEYEDNSTESIKGKVLVVYYSASGSTKRVAEEIAKNLDADLFEITPKDKYTSDDLNWSDNNSRVSKEHNDESLRKVELTTTNVNGWEEYETVLIGYPIWWGIAAWPVDTFVTSNVFTGKTVIPFCTSVSSGLGQSGKLLEIEAKGGNWLEGYRFSSNASDSEIKSFTDIIK